MTVSDDDISTMIDDELLQRRTKVMFLRNAGATWAKVAEECKVSIATVRKDMDIVQRDINNEQPNQVIARHRAVIFDIQRANYPAMMRGDKDAAMVILRALHRESKLLGLDSPARVLASVSADDFNNEAARLIQSILDKDADTLKELTTDAHRPIIDAEEVPDPEPVRRTPFDRPSPGAGQAGPVDDGPADAPDGGAGWASGGGSAPADAPERQPELPGPPGPPQHDRAADVLPDDDDGWSNL